MSHICHLNHPFKVCYCNSDNVVLQPWNCIHCAYVYVAAKFQFKRNYSFASEWLISLMMLEQNYIHDSLTAITYDFPQIIMFHVSYDRIIWISDDIKPTDRIIRELSHELKLGINRLTSITSLIRTP